ncbi:hypothetical protein [Thiomicrorhabdus sediminis]|uniref:Phage integrase family protein n=1 Tax=Thiomicrorhabdus sediminis TaxID=2580412 RepID=A0A4P9K964_9GAMM|nr:hypothetical protein [Thiomicrorhabdus sediminis]QCU90976.1 hypothetical protein FE785_10235 [Thiomicrorhabdus sediminis]
MTKIEQLLQHFSESDKRLFHPVIEKFTGGKNPLIAPTLSQLHKTSRTLLQIAHEENVIHFDETELNFIKALNSKNTDLLYAFGERGDTKKQHAIDLRKYPTYYALNALHEKSPLLFHAVTKILVWNYANNNELIQSRTSYLVDTLFNQEHQITNTLSELIKSLTENNENADLILIASKIRNEAFRMAHELDDNENKIAETLVYLIDQAFSSHQAQNPDLLEPATITENDTQDSPIIFNPAHSQEDSTEIEDISIEIVPKDVAEKSTYYQRGYAQQTQLKNAKRAQFLDNASEVLTKIEKEHLISLALDENSDVAFAVLFSLATHAEPSFWWDWPIGSIDKSPSTECIIDIDKFLWRHPVSLGKRFWKPTEEQKPFVHPSQQYITLPLATELCDFIAKRSNSNQTLGQILHLSKDQINESCDVWLRKNIDFGRRITISKVRNFLYWQIMINRFDETAASFICAQPILQTPQGNTYTSIQQTELQRIYTEALPQLSFGIVHTESDPLIGSNLLAKESYLKEVFNQLANTSTEKVISANTNPSLSNLIDAHNALTSYCIMFGLLVTAHRPNIDPFARYADIIWDIHSIMISDKIVNEGHATRVAIFSSSFKIQLKRYTKHLVELAERLQAFDYVDEANQVMDLLCVTTPKHLPFFFYLSCGDEQLTFQSVSEKTLTEYIPDFQLPFNFGRHFLSSVLRDKNIPAEFINYQLGHQGPGEEPYSSSSPLCAEMVSKVLLSVLDEICEQLEIRAIHGIQTSQSVKPKDTSKAKKEITFDSTHELGPIKRIKAFRDLKKASRKLVATVFQNYITSQEHDLLEDNQTVILSEAVDRIVQGSKNYLAQNLKVFSYLLKRHAKKHNLKITLPNKLLQIKNEESPFDYLRLPLWHKMRLARETFVKSLESTDFEKISNTALWGYFFLSLILFSRFTHKQRYPLIVNAILSDDLWGHEEKLYLDLTTRENQVQRIALEPVTALLAIKLIERRNCSPLKPLSLLQVQKTIEKTLRSVVHDESMTFNELITGAEMDCKLFMPGILAAVQSGERKTASLNKESFLRVVTDTRLNLYEEKQKHAPESKPNLELLSLLPVISKLPSSHQDYQTLEKMLKGFRKYLNEPGRLNRKELTTKISYELHRLNTFETPPPQIVYLIGMWAAERLNSPGEKKESLSFSTVYDYFLILDRRLLEHFMHRDVLSEELDSLIETYNAIILSHTDEDQSLAAAQIINFHNLVCSKYLGLSEIRKDELEFASSHQEESIDANFITIAEKTKIDNYLTAKDRYSHDLGLQFSLILTCYAKLGFRANELFKLESRDVIHANHGYKGYFTCRHNRHGRQKNANSHRNVFSTGKLTPTESDVLQKWITIRAPQSADHFWIYDSDTKEQNKLAFQRTLTEAVRIITGDISLSIRNLRHTAATLEFLGYFQYLNDFLNNPIDDVCHSFQIDSWYEQDVANYINDRFKNTYPSRRFAYRIAQLLGHGSPYTTLKNYSHFYEFVIPMFQHRGLSEVTNQAIVNLTPVYKIENLRNIKSRIGKKTTSNKPDILAKQVLNDVARKALSGYQNIHSAITPLRARGKLPRPEPANRQPDLSIIQIYEILCLLARNNIDDLLIAERFNLSQQQLTQLKADCLELFERTGLNPGDWQGEDFESPMSSEEGEPLPNAMPLKDSLNLLSKINTLACEKDEEFTTLIQLWEQYVQPQKNFWFFEKRFQQTEMIRLLNEVIDIPCDLIVLTSDAEALKTVKEEQFEDSIRIRYAKRGTSLPIARLRQPHLNKKIKGVAIINQNDTRFLNSELNQVFFLARLRLDWL